MPPLLLRDAFTGVPTKPTSGPAPFATVDNLKSQLHADFFGTPAAGHQLEYTLTFPSGTLTFRARWIGAADLVLERISTIPGTNNGTATLRTFSGTSTSKPATTGGMVRMGITVNRGAANNQTAVSFHWHGRASTGTLEQTTDNFFLDGELTPTAGSYAIAGPTFMSRPHLAGRTPDGGGNPALAQGTYAQAMGWKGETISPAEILQIVANGQCVPGYGTFGDTVYVVSGLGVSADQVARLYGRWDSNNFGVGILAARLQGNWWDGTLKGYTLFLFGNADGTISPWLYKWTNGTAFFLDEAADQAVADGAVHFWDLSVIGDQIVVALDGVTKLTVTDAEHAVGEPGFGGYRSSTLDAGVEFTQFEVEGTAGTACSLEISRIDFDTTTTDVDGAPMTSGVLLEHAASVGTVSAAAGFARKTAGPGKSLHLCKDIVGLTNDYCVEVRGRFPARDGAAGGVTRVLIWEDNFDSLGSGVALDGRVGFPGGSAGTGTWQRMLKNDPDVDGPTCVGDGDGRVKQPSGVVGVLNWSLYKVSGLTLPADIDLEIDLYAASNVYGKTGAMLRYQGVNGAETYYDGYWWHVRQDQGGSYYNSYHAAVNGQPVGALGQPGHIIGVGNTKEFESRIRGTSPGVVRVYWNGVRDFADGLEQIVFYDGQFTGGVRDNFLGTVGLNFREDGPGLENPLRVAGFRVYSYIIVAGNPASEYGVMSAGVRYDQLSENGYRLDLEFDHRNEFFTQAFLTLRHLALGTSKIMRQWPAAVGHGGDQSAVLSVQGTVLTASLNGVVQGSFDVATDVCDEGGSPAPNYTTGLPTFALQGDHLGDVELDRVVVYGQEEDVPCTGGPDNPYPTGDPPPTDPVPIIIPAWKHGAFRLCHEGWEWRNGVFRKIVGPEIHDEHGVWKHGVYRPIGYFDGETEPEPNTPLPPHHDPCFIAPPVLPPGPLLPITGRFFGMSNSPLGSLGNGSVFNGTQKALGNWYTSDLPFCASRQSYLVGGPGGGARIKLYGRLWDYNFFLNAWRGILAAIYPTLVAYGPTGSGWNFGNSIADDVTSESLWGPGGIDFTEFASVVSILRSEFPGIRFGARMRPSQVGFNLGLDFYFVQYSAERGSASVFASQEYSLALARNAYLIMCINFLHGGDGRSGVRYANGTHKGQSEHNWMCSPTEVVEYGMALLDAVKALEPSGAHMPGFLGYQYNTGFLALTDGNYTMPQALSVLRNYMVTLFP